jgi:hypothetical protein
MINQEFHLFANERSAIGILWRRETNCDNEKVHREVEDRKRRSSMPLGQQ